MIRLHKFIFYIAHAVGTHTAIVGTVSKRVKAFVDPELPWMYATIITSLMISLGIIDVLNLVEYLASVRLKIHPFFYFYGTMLFTGLALIIVWYADLDDKIVVEVKELSKKKRSLWIAMSVLYVLGLMVLFVFLKIQMAPPER